MMANEKEELIRLETKVDKMGASLSAKIDDLAKQIIQIAVIEERQKNDKAIIENLSKELRDLNQVLVKISGILENRDGEKKGFSRAVIAMWTVGGSLFLALLWAAGNSIVSLNTKVAIIENTKAVQRDERPAN